MSPPTPGSQGEVSGRGFLGRCRKVLVFGSQRYSLSCRNGSRFWWGRGFKKPLPGRVFSMLGTKPLPETSPCEAPGGDITSGITNDPRSGGRSFRAFPSIWVSEPASSRRESLYFIKVLGSACREGPGTIRTLPLVRPRALVIRWWRNPCARTLRFSPDFAPSLFTIRLTESPVIRLGCHYF
jgi:hypothetical protein